MISYRQAIPSDVPFLVSLLGEIMEHHGVVPPDPARLRETVSTILASSWHLLLVAESQDRLVAMCALIFSESTWSASAVCEVQDVLVTTQYRRARIGRGLLAEAERIARQKGCSRLFLLAESWNLEAHAFYRSLGLAEKTCLYFERDLSEPPKGPRSPGVT